MWILDKAKEMFVFNPQKFSVKTKKYSFKGYIEFPQLSNKM